jgi:CMP-N,N'-diacetyllegionaminic acid synthase
MDFLAVICARAGSKGAVSKNTRDFLGYPICYYTLSALAIFLERFGGEYGGFDLAVNTDSPELLRQIDATAFSYLNVPRRESLAGDEASKLDVIRDTLEMAGRAAQKDYGVVLDMDLTSPLRRAADIKNVIDALLAGKGAEAAISVTEARRNPYFNQLARRGDGYYGTAIASDFVARQQAPEVYDANASLYAYDAEFLRGGKTALIRARLAVSVMPDTGVLDIDSERDYELMQVLAEHFYDTDPDFGEIREGIKDIVRPEGAGGRKNA